MNESKINREELKMEVEELKKKGLQFEAGELSRGELKGYSGGLGCYAQKDAGKYMIRLKTPSGVIEKEIFKLIIDYCDKYQIEQLHLTTRQAIQLHDLSIDEVCNIMKDGIDKNLFSRGGGGNFPRNVALSPLAGVDPQEAFDVTPYALQAGQYFQERVTSYHLPRKFKVAFSSSIETDTACATVNDMGFVPVKVNGRLLFKLYAAGGIGGSPGVGYPLELDVEPEQLLYYIEAMVNLFIAEGDYQNKSKARLRFIPRKMGFEAFVAGYKEQLQEVIKTRKFEGITPVSESLDVWSNELEGYPMVIAQKQRNSYTVVVHPLCGQLDLADAKTLYNFVSGYEQVELRSSMNEDIYIRNLSKDEALLCIEAVHGFNGIDQIARTVTCIGTPSCQQGVIESQSLCRAINSLIRSEGMNGDLLPAIHISGCMSSCSRHQAVPIGFMGRKKRLNGAAVDCFELFLAGMVGENAKLGRPAGLLPADVIPYFILNLGRLLAQSTKVFAEVIETEEFTKLLKKYVISE